MTEPFPIHQSNMYLAWMEEKMHIGRNRWFLSEKAGYDVGEEFAKWDWNMNHRAKWLRAKANGVQYHG